MPFLVTQVLAWTSLGIDGGLSARADSTAGFRNRSSISVRIASAAWLPFAPKKSIAEMSDPSVLAGQLNEHRAEMNGALLAEGGTVMQFVGDAVMAVFGAPFEQPDHAERAVRAAATMHARQAELNKRWESSGLPAFHLGIGISTGDVAAALLGSEERLEYSVVGDAVNLAQRLQQWGEGGQTVLSDPTYALLASPPECERLEPALVKGRQTPVGAHRLGAVLGVPS